MKAKQILSTILSHLLKYPVLFVFICITILISSASIMLVPIFIKNIIDNIGVVQASFSTVLPMSIVALLGSIVSFIQTLLITYMIEKIVLDMRQEVVVHSLNQSMNYYSKEPIGKMVTRITKDLDEAGNFIQTILRDILSSAVSLVVVLTILFITNGSLLLYTAIGIPFVVLFAEYYRRRILTESKHVRTYTGVLNTYLSEHLQGSVDLQLNNKVQESEKYFDIHNDVLFTHDRRLGINQMFVRPSLNLILMIIIASVAIGGAFLANNALVTVGTLFVFIQLIQSVFSPILNIAQVISQIQTSMVSLDRIFSFLKIDTALRDEKHMPHREVEYTSQIGKTLKIDKVNFSYVPGSPILKNIDITLEPGKKIALVGHSGSGKSTISKLIMRFWDPDNGTITFDGIDIQEFPLVYLRSKIVLLEQDSFIFKDSIRENICIGRDIAQEVLDNIAEKTGLSKLIRQFPERWDHVVDASAISVGEQRLIAIARVLVSPPDIIILDEFSATLDNTTEQLIQSLLEEIQADRASLVIAHRLNTILRCDEILYIEDGAIEERGSHESLLAKNGGYAKLIQNMNESSNIDSQ